MTWQVGDLAVRVAPTNTTSIFGALPGHELPQKGKVYVVEAIAFDIEGNTGLVLVGAHSGHPRAPAWMASGFRKVVRDQHEACEPEFVTLLNRVKRRQSA